MYYRSVLFAFILSVAFPALAARSAHAWNTANTFPVMGVQSGVNGKWSLAYDFSVTDLGPSVPPSRRYAAIFHAEPMKAALCQGDSVAVKYSSTPFGFGMHNQDEDYVITRAMNNDAQFQASPTCADYSGAANPILIYNQGAFWGIYYLTVNKVNDLVRHNLMAAIVNYGGASGASIADLANSPMYYLGKDSTSCAWWPACGASGTGADGVGMAWYPMLPQNNGLGALAGRTYDIHQDPAPAHDQNWRRMASSVGYTTADTWGLQGSMTYARWWQDLYYYYTDVVYEDCVPGHPEEGKCYKQKLFRRSGSRTGPGGPGSPDFYHLTQFSEATPIKWPGNGSDYNSVKDVYGWNGNLVGMTHAAIVAGKSLVTGPSYIKVNYSPALDKYVVLYGCANGTKGDICLKLSANADLSDIDLKDSDSIAYGLHLYDDPAIAPWGDNYGIGQFNIRKDGWGFHESDGNGDVIVYFPFNGGSRTQGPYGPWMWAKQVFIPH